MRYVVDLRDAADAEPLSQILNSDNIAVSPTIWMWRPRLRSSDEIIAEFTLDAGGRVFVPWQRLNTDGTRYRLTASPQSGSAIALFGDFEEQTWQAFWMSAVEDMQAPEVAEKLGISANAVRQAKFRVVRRLKEYLGL